MRFSFQNFNEIILKHSKVYKNIVFFFFSHKFFLKSFLGKVLTRHIISLLSSKGKCYEYIQALVRWMTIWFQSH
jgi:hypothetical protein